jgi:hypothetical protein
MSDTILVIEINKLTLTEKDCEKLDELKPRYIKEWCQGKRVVSKR